MPLRSRFKNERFARSTINSAVLAMIAAGMFEKHAGLKVVVTALALGGLLLADRVPVVAGSDRPVVQEKNLGERLSSMLAGFGLRSADSEQVAAGNASELLGA